MPLLSNQFLTFANTSNIKTIITSSPTYSQSNGQAERWLQTMKNVLKKAHEQNRDPYLGKALKRLTRTSPEYNWEVANAACRERRLLGTHQWQSALLVVGLPVTRDWFEMGCHLSPSLISIRLTA